MLYQTKGLKNNPFGTVMAKRAFDREWLPEPNIWDPGSFAPASSQDPPAGAIVLHEAFLDFPSTSAAGMPGIFSCPADCRNLERASLTPPQQASYDLVIQDIPLSAHKIVRYIISPASDITIIPTNLQSNTYSTNYFTNDSTNVQETAYLLQSKKGTSTLASGLRSNVKLDLVLWDFERFTREGGIYGGVARKFQIDGAVLLDPNRPGQFRPSESPVCLLGMDFLVKYPYLLFEPKYDPHGEVDFTLARGSLVRRPYSTCTEVNMKLVIHISARHDIETGKIGCGVFFKSGSILNLFSGVSKYDKDGNRHKEQLWERGILMGVIKALHVVGEFPAGHEFTHVIIRTGSPPTNSLLSQIQHTAEDFHKHSGNGYDDSLDDRFCCPSPNSDLVMYIYRRFIRKQGGVKIRFDGFSTNQNYDAVEAAGILASAGAEMEEFYLEKEDRSMSLRHSLGYSINQFRGHKHKGSPDITLLHQHGGFVGHSIYVNLGLDGYFHIPKERAHAVMEAADKKACLTLSREDAVFTLGYAPWEGEVAAKPNGFLETKNYEYHAISPLSDFKTLDGILGEDAANKLKNCLKSNTNSIRQIVLETIRGSNRGIALHEFLSMQTKEFRDEYLKELEWRGLEKGWHFCKDKSWNGYLRRNTRVYDEDGWMRLQGGKKIGDGIALGSGKWGAANGAHQEKRQETLRAEVDAGPTKVRNRMEYSRRHTESCDKVHSEIAVGVTRADVKGESDHNHSPCHHLCGDCRYDTGGNYYTIGINDWMNTEELTDSRGYTNREVNTLTRNTTNQMEDMGIGARVAARHRQLSKARYTNSRDIGLDENRETDGSSDSSYRDNRDNSDDHSSEQWLDSEDSLDVSAHPSEQSWPGCRNMTDSYDSSPTAESTGTNRGRQWKLRFNGARLTVVGGFSVAGSYKSGLQCAHGGSLKLRCSASPFEMAIDRRRKEHKGNPMPLNVPGKSSVLPRDVKNSTLGEEWVENKWPLFDWMLENFEGDDPTALP